jgi:hypothetical protein
MLLVEIGSDMEVFGSADRLGSWVGICPGNNESAGKRKSGHVRKGNLYVRRLLCEFADAASRTTSVFKSKFHALVVRRGHKPVRRIRAALRHNLVGDVGKPDWDDGAGDWNLVLAVLADCRCAPNPPYATMVFPKRRLT